MIPLSFVHCVFFVWAIEYCNPFLFYRVIWDSNLEMGVTITQGKRFEFFNPLRLIVS